MRALIKGSNAKRRGLHWLFNKQTEKVEYEANYLWMMFLNNWGTCQEMTQFLNTNNQFCSQMNLICFFFILFAHQDEEMTQMWLCRQTHCVQVALVKQTVSSPNTWAHRPGRQASIPAAVLKGEGNSTPKPTLGLKKQHLCIPSIPGMFSCVKSSRYIILYG